MRTLACTGTFLASTHSLTRVLKLVTSIAVCRSVRTTTLLLALSTSAAGAQSASELGIADVLRRAVDQHPLVEAARARVTSTRGGRLTARTLPNPVITYWAENVRSPGQNPATRLDHETQTTATLPLEPLFQRWPRIRRADADVRAADADLARDRKSVV